MQRYRVPTKAHGNKTLTDIRGDRGHLLWRRLLLWRTWPLLADGHMG